MADQNDRLVALFDEVASALGALAADQAALWLVGLLVRLDLGQDGYDRLLADLDAAIRERQASGNWLGAGQDAGA